MHEQAPGLGQVRVRMATRKVEPGKAASTAPPKRLALSNKTAQAVLVNTEVCQPDSPGLFTLLLVQVLIQ